MGAASHHTRTPGDDTMTMTVRLFAVLRERAGTDALELRLPPGATVADALDSLAHYAELAQVLAHTHVVMAVNREYADPRTVLQRGDELALIPPVSGGRGSSVAPPQHTSRSARSRSPVSAYARPSPTPAPAPS